MTEQQADNIIYVGAKRFMNYVTGVVMQFTNENNAEVIVMARGKHISKAVDIAQVAEKKFLNGQIHIENVKISSEEYENKEGKQVRVSTIAIILKRNTE
ncbi:DNA/RNA-binding protein AlbA [Candidatus Woesearchaeota archaeon]|jgi:archaea-specific DNA-binding protein|nr:DNA/RNA-binding protein AlbA [Candidatus Woesearchaeota archaeon]MBT4387897.1 DNA/RNA-binding protein AlbA [Candidatus Woesearchaeota archaeon]MBT4595715.1 DNA/RNA-binding protein AlbA [Candidatus Woesearchaeota archaeon]MBT5741436.1 DNA/RNA-binding protein AlbA [Candidatus Woesearchaeota archaeon]MBT6505540.1 DNA/RNA-binding protein AlbA [Candidatus Woesearchaeota archaeon]